MKTWIASGTLLVVIVGIGASLASWKASSLSAPDAGSAQAAEPAEAVSAAVARAREHRDSTTAIGTVLALRSVTLRNELAGTVKHVALQPGQIVAPGTVLVALDVSVEQAELQAQQAQLALARTALQRLERLREHNASTDVEVDRARAERDVTLAQMARTQAIIARKTIRVPFRARVGLADVHPGQYLNEGTALTTLQSVDDAVHVDFAVPQAVAAGLRAGDRVEVQGAAGTQSFAAKVEAVDARNRPRAAPGSSSFRRTWVMRRRSRCTKSWGCARTFFTSTSPSMADTPPPGAGHVDVGAARSSYADSPFVSGEFT